MTWPARVFGLALTVGFEAPGLPRDDGAPGGRPATLDLLTADEADRRWLDGEAEVVLRQRRPEMVLELREGTGYRLTAAGSGSYLLAADGSWIGCTPPGGQEPWRWQRFLTGQVLPLAAVLRGLEVFHASAVAMGRRPARDGRGPLRRGGRRADGGGRLAFASEIATRSDRGPTAASARRR